MELDVNWIHMARYELILRLDGALWLTIILTPPDSKKGHNHSKMTPQISKLVGVALGQLQLLCGKTDPTP